MNNLERISALIAKREEEETVAALAAEQEAQKKAEDARHAPATWERVREAFEGLCSQFPGTLAFESDRPTDFSVTHLPDKRKLSFDFRDNRLFSDSGLTIKGYPGEDMTHSMGCLPCHILPNGEVGFGRAEGPFWTPTSLAEAAVLMLVSGAHYVETDIHPFAEVRALKETA